MYVHSRNRYGLKQAVVKDVKMDVGVPATVKITLEGWHRHRRDYCSAAQAKFCKPSPPMSAPQSRRQDNRIAIRSRDALDLILFMPWHADGRPSASIDDHGCERLAKHHHRRYQRSGERCQIQRRLLHLHSSSHGCHR